MLCCGCWSTPQQHTVYTYMEYTIKKLAKIAGVSVRALHYYDEIGLLSPVRVLSNGYRVYGQAELLKLQQILFFKELEFPLDEIKNIIQSPHFDITEALKDQKKLVDLKKRRLEEIIQTIDKTIKKIKNKTFMKDEELFDSLDKEKLDAYAKEAKEKMGSHRCI